MPVEVTLNDYWHGKRTVTIPDEYLKKHPRQDRKNWDYAGYDKLHGCSLGDVLAHALSLVEKHGNEAILEFEAGGDSEDGYTIEAHVISMVPETDGQYHERVAKQYEAKQAAIAERERAKLSAEAMERQMYEKLKAKYGDKV